MSPKNRNSLTVLIQERVTLSWFLIESSKWMVLTMTSITARVHYESRQSIITIRNPTKPWKSWTELYMLFLAVDGNWTMKHQMTFANTTVPLKENVSIKVLQSIKTFLWVACFMSLVRCFSFAHSMMFRKIFPNEAHQQAELLLQVQSVRNSWKYSQKAFFGFCRVSVVEKGFPRVLSQDSWYQEGPWIDSQVPRFIIATSLSIVCLIRVTR